MNPTMLPDRDREIAELRRVQQELRESEARYRSIVESAFDAIITIDHENRVTEFNPAAEAIFGWQRAEVLGRDLAELIIPPAMRDAHRRGLQRHRDSQDAPRLGVRLELPALRADGTEVPIELTVSRVAGGGLPQFTAIIRDLTERRAADELQQRAANDLRRSEARFRALTELSADWFWEQDENFRFVAIDGGSHYPPGILPAENILGRTRWELEHTELPGGVSWDAHKAQLARHEPFRNLEVLRRDANGNQRLMSLTGEPIFEDGGRFAGYRGVGSDITERRRTEDEIARLNSELEERVRQRTAQLQAANAELEAFAYSIAHDLRSPLTSIDGFSHTLDELCADAVGDQGRHYLRRIRAGVRQMSDLTDAILSLARLSRVRLRWETVDLAMAARTALAQLHEHEPSREVQVDVAPHLYAQGDPRLLAQVVSNLVGNAWKFSGRKPRTEIRVGSRPGDDGQPVYFVADCGAGFDMAYASRLFGAFQRLHTTSEFEGTGIGLALVQKIVQRHAGRIWAEARPGEGATFYFTLATEPMP